MFFSCIFNSMENPLRGRQQIYEDGYKSFVVERLWEGYWYIVELRGCSMTDYKKDLLRAKFLTNVILMHFREAVFVFIIYQLPVLSRFPAKWYFQSILHTSFGHPSALFRAAVFVTTKNQYQSGQSTSSGSDYSLAQQQQQQLEQAQAVAVALEAAFQVGLNGSVV